MTQTSAGSEQTCVGPDERRAGLHDRNLRIVFAVTLMVVMGVSSVTPAFPKVVRAFDLSAGTVGLLVTVFTLPGIFLRPVLGILADRVGRKRILVPSLFLFGLAGGACGLARDFQLLLALRFLQGVGAAALGSLNVTLIGDMFSGREQTAALGYNSAVLNVGAAGYPALGGGLALLGWNHPFFLPLLALPVGLAVALWLEPPGPQPEGELGAYVRTVLELARSPRALLLFGASFATFFLLFGAYLAFLPMLMEERFGASSLVIGVVMSTGAVASGLTSLALRRLAIRFAEPSMVRASYFLYALSLAGMVLVPGTWTMCLPVLLFGVANGLNVPNVLSMVAALAGTRHRGAMIAANGTLLRLGQTLGPLVMGAAVGVWGVAGPFVAGVGLAAVSFFVFGAVASRVGGDRLRPYRG